MSACIHSNIVECLDCDLLEGYFYLLLRCLNELAVSVRSLACVFRCTLYIHAALEVVHLSPCFLYNPIPRIFYLLVIAWERGSDVW